MTLAELKSRLITSKLPADAYCLTGGLPNEAYCIERGADGKWRVYYSERGLRTRLLEFATEDEACDCFYRTLAGELPDNGTEP